MLAGPLAGIYDPTGPGRLLFGFFTAMAETERENIREATLEGLDAASRQGRHGGRPPVITDDMLHTVLRRRANGETVEAIQPDRPMRSIRAIIHASVTGYPLSARRRQSHQALSASQR
ncbi:recombinase family protein [Nonomuraea glycinis]|uniref:Resolvase/invertase-type recombinase catalytic domain-containing protein n=1 Tax=Nonomuraea glycinis TaxID=2047744 RepID=A0A918AAX0_9ACTN|nr:recombinase family protein [Nonomuraea glycinis]MCA2181370.1 recombinase family protein [Nonomuraea glycinis]GGP14327.1 hypothetical protein GCM10012278_69680 [Nonomuraea glycinis]